MTPADAHGPRPSYDYWRDHGAGWVEEYDRRKRTNVLYHIQELMLATYFTNSAPARVLDFGCGVGRHLRYLRELSGIEVFGYDQSATMVEGCLSWATPDWIADRVVVDEPVARLPYPDRHFDVVFTSEVLVHVAPEDLDAILAELIRVSKWQVLHLEPPPGYPVDRETHGGCWSHDLVAAYLRLGHRCETLPAGYSCHVPYRLLLDAARPPYSWPSVVLSLLRRMERDLANGLRELDAHACALAGEVARLQAALDAQTAATGQAEAARTQLERQLAEEARLREDDRAQVAAREADVRQLKAARRELVRDLGARVFGQDGGLPADPERLLQSVSEMRYELDFTKASLSYRLAARLRGTPMWNAARWLRTRNAGLVTIRALGTRNERSQGTEVWLLGACQRPGQPSIPWGAMEMPDGPWTPHALPDRPYGRVLCGERGRLRFPLYGDEPTLSFMTHPWSGKAEVRYGKKRYRLDLYSAAPGSIELGLARAADKAVTRTGGSLPESPGKIDATPLRSSEVEQQWLERMHATKPAVLAIYVPRWLGVSAATQVLFDHRYPFPCSADVDPAGVDGGEVKRHARVILESGVRHIVCSGGERIHFELVREIKKKAPGVRCDLLWHGSYLQCTEDYSWSLMQLWIDGAREGLVHTLGTVKKGMERFFQSLGCRSKFVMNYVDEIPAGPSLPDPGGPHLGMWISGYSYAKLPYAMIAAVKMIPGATLRGSNFVPRMKEVVKFFEVQTADLSDAPLRASALLDAIRRTHLSLYVTFSECCPMLPLQSLSVGVPCLIGPNSHLFEDDEYLCQRLVVPYPDRADLIAGHIEAALAERQQIVERYTRYAPAYNMRARQALREFLEG